jgi:hypothetical protein
VPQPEHPYSADEKRRMILAHAAMRQTHDPLQLMSAWTGVTIAVAVIAMGWWGMSGSMFVSQLSSIGDDVRAIAADAPETHDVGTIMRDTVDKLRILEVQASNQEQQLDAMAAIVASGSSSTRELFQSISTTTETNTQDLNQ